MVASWFLASLLLLDVFSVQICHDWSRQGQLMHQESLLEKSQQPVSCKVKRWTQAADINGHIRHLEVKGPSVFRLMKWFHKKSGILWRNINRPMHCCHPWLRKALWGLFFMKVYIVNISALAALSRHLLRRIFWCQKVYIANNISGLAALNRHSLGR